MVSLTQNIKEFALDLGYSKVGVTSADGFPAYVEDLKSRYEMYAFYIEDPRHPITGANPKQIMPTARSIISVVYDYSKESFPDRLVGTIGRLYQARCNNAPEHRINGARPRLMREFLKKQGCQVGQGIFLPERLAAARAGTVIYGKNAFVFAEDIGSFIFLSSFVVDVELDYDVPTIEEKCPPECTLCIEACPTSAIYEPLKINPRRCIAFNTFRTQDGLPGGCSSYISPELRGKMRTWIHGCDVCQEVCPRNQKRLKTILPPNAFLERIADDFDLAKVLEMPKGFYDDRVQPVMYNFIKEKKYFQRNAAIAMGNTGDPGYIPALAKAMQDREELVRGYAAWALGRIGGNPARQILEAGLVRETANSAKREIEAALNIA
jgi:epoxyqueuosine reductase